MTTTKPDAIRKIEGLRDRARHSSTPAPEADTCLRMARKLCAKYDVDPSILDAQPTNGRAKPAASPTPERRYSCRFGCGMFVTHTASEMSACADKARAASSTGSAYDAPKADSFEDVMRDFFKQGPTADYTPPRDSTTRRQATSHRYCDHEATKAARAQCRKEGGPFMR